MKKSFKCSFKHSLLLSVIAIYSITPSIRCMDASLAKAPAKSINASSKIKRDALVVALEQIGQMPDDFKKLTRRQLAILTEISQSNITKLMKEDPQLTNMQAENSFYEKTIANKLAKKYRKKIITIDIVNPFLKLAKKNQDLQKKALALWSEILFPDDTTPKTNVEIETAIKKAIINEPGYIARIMNENPKMQTLAIKAKSSSLDQRIIITNHLKSQIQNNKEKIIIFPLFPTGLLSLSDVYMLMDDIPEEQRPFIIISSPFCQEAESAGIKQLKDQGMIFGFMFMPSEQRQAISFIMQLLKAKERNLNQTDLFKEGFVIVNTQRCLHKNRDKAERLDFIREILLNKRVSKKASQASIDKNEVLEIGFTTETTHSKEKLASYTDTKRKTIKIPKSLLLR